MIETPLLEEFEPWECLKMSKMLSNLLARTGSVKLYASCMKRYMELKLTAILPRHGKSKQLWI